MPDQELPQKPARVSLPLDFEGAEAWAENLPNRASGLIREFRSVLVNRDRFHIIDPEQVEIEREILEVCKLFVLSHLRLVSNDEAIQRGETLRSKVLTFYERLSKEQNISPKLESIRVVQGDNMQTAWRYAIDAAAMMIDHMKDVGEEALEIEGLPKIDLELLARGKYIFVGLLTHGVPYGLIHLLDKAREAHERGLLPAERFQDIVGDSFAVASAFRMSDNLGVVSASLDQRLLEAVKTANTIDDVPRLVLHDENFALGRTFKAVLVEIQRVLLTKFSPQDVDNYMGTIRLTVPRHTVGYRKDSEEHFWDVRWEGRSTAGSVATLSIPRSTV